MPSLDKISYLIRFTPRPWHTKDAKRSEAPYLHDFHEGLNPHDLTVVLTKPN